MIIVVSFIMIVVSFNIRQQAVQIEEQTTQVSSNILLTILKYQNIANILCGVATVLLCLLLFAFAHKILKKQHKRGE